MVDWSLITGSGALVVMRRRRSRRLQQLMARLDAPLIGTALAITAASIGALLLVVHA